MAAVRDLRRLFEAIARKDWMGAQSVADLLTEAEEKRGNRDAARSLRAALQPPKVAVPAPSSVLELGLTPRSGQTRLSEVRLPQALRREFNSLVDEFRHREGLASQGFGVRKRLILTGPPGCGKTLSALAIANEIGLPLYTVRFDSIIGSYLGQTANNLRQLFKFSETTPAVLLFDEIDALGKHRGNPTEVGELDRIVIALMQELELAEPLGLIVATSNLPEHLDRALWRRFDIRLRFPSPKKPDLRAFASSCAVRFDTKLPLQVLRQAEASKSYAEAEKSVLNHYREAALSKLKEPNGTD